MHVVTLQSCLHQTAIYTLNPSCVLHSLVQDAGVCPGDQLARKHTATRFAECCTFHDLALYLHRNDELRTSNVVPRTLQLCDEVSQDRNPFSLPYLEDLLTMAWKILAEIQNAFPVLQEENHAEDDPSLSSGCWVVCALVQLDWANMLLDH